MRINRIFAIAAAVAALAACTKQQAIETCSSFKKGQEVTLNVTVDASATKVTSALNGTAIDFKWQEGDKIKVKVGADSAEFTLSSGAGAASATFTGTMPANGETFSVQYPVTDPVLTTQTYSSTEAIPHNMMKFAASGCTTSSPFSLSAQNAALRLNLWGTSQTISKIVVTNTTSSADPKPSYTLTMDTAVTLPTTEAAAQAFFIVVPAGDWNFSAEIFDNAATPASICTFSPSAAQSFVANTVLNMPAVEVAVPAPSPVISGDFTINSSGTTVKFSKGNLQATCTSAGSETTATYSWGFAVNQWDYFGDASGNTTIDSQTDGAVVDLFGWVGASSTTLTGDFTKYGISTKMASSDYGKLTTDTLKADWADISTLPQISGRKWKTMTSSEWTYLLSTRTVTVKSESETSYGEGSVNGVNGLIILPDNWDGSVCSDFTYGTSSWLNTFNESTTPNWSDMENAGCVFLPAAGCRDESSLLYGGSFGIYWSATPGDACAYLMDFYDSSVDPAQDGGRNRGYSVRLVSAAL